MSIDVDDLVATISAGIYGDDRMTWRTIEAATTALSQLVAEVQQLRADVDRYGRQLEAAHDRGVAEERAAVVAWLNAEADIVDCGHIEDLADRIERGEHRREEE